MYDGNGAKLVFGCGYLGLRVARLWRAAGWHVIAVTRSEDRSLELAGAGLFTIVADVTQPQSLPCIEKFRRWAGEKLIASCSQSGTIERAANRFTRCMPAESKTS